MRPPAAPSMRGEFLTAMTFAAMVIAIVFVFVLGLRQQVAWLLAGLMIGQIPWAVVLVVAARRRAG